ncbi:MAG: acylphosphatase [Lentisphaerales bacterium]|nr:MAG: acylphosphatase [Lentisphaerales bacterium]
MKKRAHLEVSGRVQGVCFRFETVEQAERLGLVGWVRNTTGGNVAIVAEGEEKDLSDLAEWCHKGPSMAQVTNVSLDFSEATGEFRTFTIRYTVAD